MSIIKKYIVYINNKTDKCIKYDLEIPNNRSLKEIHFWNNFGRNSSEILKIGKPGRDVCISDWINPNLSFFNLSFLGNKQVACYIPAGKNKEQLRDFISKEERMRGTSYIKPKMTNETYFSFEIKKLSDVEITFFGDFNFKELIKREKIILNKQNEPL